MNRTSLSILVAVHENPGITQRELAKQLSLSPASINQHLQSMREKGYIRGEGREKRVTRAGIARKEAFRVQNALILTSRPGILFLPQEDYTPKGLVEVRGEPMVERQIKQLKAAGIADITLLVGYRKEQFEYLIDRYDVKLLLILDYQDRNALSSLYHARGMLKNTYILHGDHYIEGNPFRLYDCESWYGDVRLEERSMEEWYVQADARGRMRSIVVGGEGGRAMLGPAHFTQAFTDAFMPYLEESGTDPKYNNSPWEIVLLEHLHKLPSFFVRPMENIYKLSSLESLRRFDPAYRDRLQEQAVEVITSFFGVEASAISEIARTKEGMNNASFLFRLGDTRYILRIPMPGANDLVDRQKEGNCYETLRGRGLVDDPVFFDSHTGIKLTKFFENCRIMDDDNPADVEKYVAMLRQLHSSGIVFGHDLDHRRLIRAYESLSLANGGIPYRDYAGVKAEVLHILEAMEGMERPWVSCHNDTAAVNFLVLEDGGLCMIDWEYGGMCDPMNDLATHAIFVYATPEQSKALLVKYLQREPTREELVRLYGHLAVIGFTWSLWAVYKSNLGIEFGDYGILNYRCGKLYARIARALLEGKAELPDWSMPILS